MKDTIFAYPGSLIYSEEKRAGTEEFTKTALLSDEKYLASVNLMKVPDHCPTCDDSGWVNDEGEIDGEKFYKANVLRCPDCTDNPAAWVNVKQIGG